MHVYYFITPVSTGHDFNPGCTFITYGCKYLISQVDPDAVFLDVSILNYSKNNWDILLDQADCLIFSGNPRYNPSDVHSYWDFDIWDHISRAQSKGILIADLWGGSAYPLPLIGTDSMVEKMLTFSRNKRTLEFQSTLDMVVSRDPCAQKMISTVRDDVHVFPCSSFWAAQYLKITSFLRPFNCVTLRYTPGDEWMIKSLYDLYQNLSKERRTYYLCHAGFEYWWAKKHLPEIPNLICISDPIALLRFYSMCFKVISMRLHGSIPALSLGCRVINIATDSRCLAFDFFGFSSIPYTSFKDLSIDLNYSYLKSSSSPSYAPFTDQFNSKILSRLDHV